VLELQGENECFGWEKGAERKKQVCCGEEGLLSKQEVAVVTALARAHDDEESDNCAE
jgi:hypothetical protein